VVIDDGAVALKCDENGNVSFVSGRLSTNDGLMHEHIGDLEQECTTLEECDLECEACAQTGQIYFLSHFEFFLSQDSGADVITEIDAQEIGACC
jgi:hypothetical protein